MTSRGRNYVTCPNCRTMYDAGVRNPRCPSCNERYDEREALPPLPPIPGRFAELQDPDFERGANGDSDTAPLSEFLAAFVILGAFILMVTGVFVRSPLVLTLGMGIMGGAAVVYAIAKVRSMFGRRDDAYRGPGLSDYLFGRGFWGSREDDGPPPGRESPRRRGR